VTERALLQQQYYFLNQMLILMLHTETIGSSFGSDGTAASLK